MVSEDRLSSTPDEPDARELHPGQNDEGGKMLHHILKNLLKLSRSKLWKLGGKFSAQHWRCSLWEGASEGKASFFFPLSF